MSDKIDTKNHPTVKALIALRDRLELSDAGLARRDRNSSKTTWSQLQSGTYPAQDPAAILERCESGLRLLEDFAERTTAAGQEARAEIIDLPHVRATPAAVKRCHGEPQNRLVVVLGPSGAGKTTVCRRVCEAYGHAAVAIEATESWRTSYHYSLAAVADAIDIPEATIDPRRLEGFVFDELARTPRILVIDEGHYFGPPALHLLKVILNKTETRIVLAAIPELWHRMEKKAYEEVLQLRRRTAAKVVVMEVTRDDCRTFLKRKLPGYTALEAEEKQVVAACSVAANRFGLYDTLARICSEVRTELGEKEPASLDAVNAAIRRVEALRS